MNRIVPTPVRGLAHAAALIAAAAIVAPTAPSSLSAQGGKAPQGKARTPTPVLRPLVWPPPPDQARIRYVTSYHGVGDFKTKKPGRWKTLLLGEDDPSQRPSDVMVKPYGIAVSNDGRVFVSDTAARRVFTFDPDAKTVTFVGESGTGKLTKPIGVALDDEGKVFVADATLNRVFGYAPDGSLALAMGHEAELKAPSGLAADRLNKRIYVADAAMHHIVCYSTIDGSEIRTIGERGTEPGKFNFPTNLFVDGKGRLYVSDTLNFRVQVFDADGKVLSVFGTQGDTGGSFNRPKGVGVDSEGHIYVADTSFNNFQVFDPEGHLLLFVGSAGHDPGEFYLPAGLYVDALDRIYVADQGNSRVQVFQYLRSTGKD
jgi:DNA-binding beta-propeller fold protein YncE